MQFELEWWTRHRSAPPILVDVTGGGDRWVPKALQRKWPDTQWVRLDLELLASSGQERLADEVEKRLVEGIATSEQITTHEDLERLARANNRWKIGALATLVALVVAGSQWYRAHLATQGALSAKNLADDFASEANTATADLYLERASTVSGLERLLFAAKALELVPSPRTRGLVLEESAKLSDPLWTSPEAYGLVESLAFAPNAPMLATGGWSGSVPLWNTETGNRDRELEGPLSQVTVVAFSPDGSQLVAGDIHGSVAAFYLPSGDLRGSVRARDAGVSSLVFTAGNSIVSAHADGAVLRTSLDGEKPVEIGRALPAVPLVSDPEQDIVLHAAIEDGRPRLHVTFLDENEASVRFRGLDRGLPTALAYSEGIAYACFGDHVGLYRINDRRWSGPSPAGSSLRETTPSDNSKTS